MEALFARLRERGIAYVFPHLIPFDAAGRLPPHDREQMRAFLAAARRVAPDLQASCRGSGACARATSASGRARSSSPTSTQRQRIVAEAAASWTRASTAST